jgi:hypothetical protein
VAISRPTDQYDAMSANVPLRRSDLERSMPFEPMRLLDGLAGDALIAALGPRLAQAMPRRRALRAGDAARLAHSLNVLLANLVVAAFNRVDPHRFIAMSFNINDYSGTPLSVTALARLRDALLELGLVEGRRGYRHVVDGQVRHARKTRLRATDQLRALFRAEGVNRSDVVWADQRDIILLREPDVPGIAEPADVTASRASLERINAAIAGSRISLPDAAWERVIERYRALDENEDDRVLAGDVGSTVLSRIFKGGWDRGGRLYGGWWINLPKVERAHLSIDGEATVERDYGRLHPTLLFARLGQALDFDIYSVAGFEGPAVRDLGKRTFNRLINTSSSGPLRLVTTRLDRAQLPAGVSFAAYLRAFIDQLAPVAHWFGTGVGLQLQREDSDLAIGVLERLLDAGIVALPVHDSFIVQARHEDRLETVMRKIFEERYRLPVIVR